MKNPTFKKGSWRERVYNYLSDNPQRTNKQIMSALGGTRQQISHALNVLKDKGLIGKKNKKWAIGQEHSYADTRTQILNMIEAGCCDASDIAKVLGNDPRTVSTEISHLRALGIKIKRVYVFDND